MSKKILLIGANDEGKSDLLIATLKEKYGEDILVVTPEEAKEQGLKMEDFDNLPTMKITAPLIQAHPTIVGANKSGKENRRQRRKQERKNKKKHN